MRAVCVLRRNKTDLEFDLVLDLVPGRRFAGVSPAWRDSKTCLGSPAIAFVCPCRNQLTR